MESSNLVETPPSVWSAAYRGLTIGLLLVVTVAAFETLAVATILPAITRELGGTAWYGWAFSAFLLTRLIGITLAGAEIDRIGPAIPFTGGVLSFMLGLLIAGLAPSMPILILGRVVQGFGSGIIGSASYVIIARGYPEVVRPRMLALNSTAWVVPGIIGPALAGIIGDQIGWRWVFLGLIPLPLLALLLTTGKLKSLARISETARDFSQVILSIRLALGAAILTAGFALAFPLGLLMIGLGLIIALPALHRLLPERALVAAPGLPAAVACMGLLSLHFFGADAFIPLALDRVRGQSIELISITITCGTVAWTLGSWILDRYAHQYSRRAFALSGLVLILVGIGGCLLTLDSAIPAWFFVIAASIMGLGIGLTYTTLSLVTLELAPSGREGASSAGLQVNDTLGAALGTGIGGALIAVYGDAATASALNLQFMLMAVVGGVAMLAALRLPGKRVIE